MYSLKKNVENYLFLCKSYKETKFVHMYHIYLIISITVIKSYSSVAF